MRVAYRHSIGAAAVMVAALTVSPHLVAQQTKSTAAPAKGAAVPASAGKVLRTPWGDPDLQGIWNGMVDVPFERRLPGERPPVNEEDGPPGAPPVLRDTLGNPTSQRATGDGPTHWYEKGRSLNNVQTSLVIDPPDGRVPPMTPEALKQRRAYDESMVGVAKDEPRRGGWLENADPWLRCITRGVPGMYSPVGTAYNMNFLVTQGPGWVAILSEMIHETRIIPLDGRPALPSDTRQWLGDSRGHWEGNTLVVETTNISPKMHGLWQEKTWYAGPNTKVTERYTRLDADTLDFRFTIDDPTKFTRPWTAAIPWSTSGAPDRILEYACHEGNYGLANILSGARAREKAEAEKPADSKAPGSGR